MNRRVILIGHRGHPEVVGTLGQAVSEPVILIQSTADAATLPIDKARSYGLVMQTTLCVSDAEDTHFNLPRFPERKVSRAAQ